MIPSEFRCAITLAQNQGKAAAFPPFTDEQHRVIPEYMLRSQRRPQHARHRSIAKRLGDPLTPMHALRRHVLLRAVEALIHGRRLTLIDVAHAWPGAGRIRASLKALDRLLGNPHLHRWLLRGPHPVIVLDWCDLKADRR